MLYFLGGVIILTIAAYSDIPHGALCFKVGCAIFAALALLQDVRKI